MQKQQLESKSIGDIFTPELAESFKVEVDRAIKKLDLQVVEAVLVDYQIAHFQDSIDFLEALDPVLNQWIKKGLGSMVIGSVTSSSSRCIACEIGKKMTVYEFEYKHADAPVPMNRVHYSRDFGILIDIRNGILFEIRVCNAFLNKKEMENLTAG